MFDEDINEENTMDKMMDDNAEVSAAIAGADEVEVDEGHDYDTKGTPLMDPEDEEDPERYMKGKVGGRVVEDSEGEETYNYGEDEGEDEKRLRRGDLSKSHAAALRKDMEYDEDHEDRDEPGTNFRESYLPQGRSIRENARRQTYVKLVEKWCKQGYNTVARKRRMRKLAAMEAAKKTEVEVKVAPKEEAIVEPMVEVAPLIVTGKQV